MKRSHHKVHIGGVLSCCVKWVVKFNKKSGKYVGEPQNASSDAFANGNVPRWLVDGVA